MTYSPYSPFTCTLVQCQLSRFFVCKVESLLCSLVCWFCCCVGKQKEIKILHTEKQAKTNKKKSYGVSLNLIVHGHHKQFHLSCRVKSSAPIKNQEKCFQNHLTFAGQLHFNFLIYHQAKFNKEEKKKVFFLFNNNFLLLCKLYECSVSE